MYWWTCIFLKLLFFYYRIKSTNKKFQAINETVLYFLNYFWEYETNNINKICSILNNEEDKQIFAIKNKTRDKFYEIIDLSVQELIYKKMSDENLKKFKKNEKIVKM